MTKGVRPARPADLVNVVAVHEAAFPGFFLTTLGRGFLQALYTGFSQAADGLLLVACDDERLLGFVAGTTAPEHFYRRLLLSRGIVLAGRATGAALRRPTRVIPRLARALIYRGEKPADLPNAALLASIGVDPASGGSGVGGALVEAFCQAATAAGREQVYLTTDRDDNERVQKFYARVGFTLIDSITRADGRAMQRYVRRLPASGSSARHE